MDQETFEVYLLMLKALEGGPYPKCAEELRKKLEENVKETRLDFLGNQHAADLNQLLARYPNINSATLTSICQHLKNNLDTTMPPSQAGGTTSYLGAGQFSLLRTPEILRVQDVQYSVKALLAHRFHSPAYKNYSINIYKHLQARKARGPVNIRRAWPTEVYTRMNLYKKIMGHLSSVYCLCFDQTGQYIFTGADDHLIKIWSARDGRLLKTLRGHDGEITDMSVNYENRLLASGGMDRIIRIWDLKTTRLMYCLNAHSAMVTSVKFAPYNRHGDDRYLISTSNDGSVIFWGYHVDKYEFRKIKKFQERNRPGGRIVCSSFSTGGSFLACGSSDNYIHVYGFHPNLGPYWMDELGVHTDQVDSIQFSNHGFRFITGSQDGTAIIWTYKEGKWKPLRLDMLTKLDQTIAPLLPKQARPKVLIVQWSRDDRFVMTSIVDYTIKVWDSVTGRLVHILDGHKHDVYLIESHPFDPRVFLSASHDGTMVLWDLEKGKPLKKFQNRVETNEAPGFASIYDVKFSPDGNMIAFTDSYGYLAIYGNASNEHYKKLPDEMFFHTDYRALIRDMRHFVMDEQTHIAPHLMPKPTLVDMNGNPYEPYYQSLVTDFTSEHRSVVPPLNQTQINCIGEAIVNHSRSEDDEYLLEKNTPPKNLVTRPITLTDCSGTSRYNTRNSTRNSFRDARSNFRSRRTRGRVLYYYDDNAEADEEYRPQRRRQLRHSSTEEEEEEEEEENDDDDTDEETEIEGDNEDQPDNDSDEETEIDDGDDDETVIDSEATEIDEPSNLASERPVGRRSERLRDRKRLRTS